jgi:hypothetical protein
VLLTSAACVAASGISCTDTSGTYLKPDAGIGGEGGGTASSSGVGGGFTVDGMVCEDRCTNDLKKVVKCNGDVKQECMSDQGCYDAECIADPCVAADKSKSSYGCDYWALKTGLLDKAEGACFAAYVANTWSTAVNIDVDYKGQKLDVATFAYIPKGQGSSECPPNMPSENCITYEPYDAAKGLGVGEVAILFLARNPSGFVPNCPKPAAILEETGVSGTGMGDAFHIKTDKPVVAYQILPYGGGISAFTSATLLLPTSAWDINYIAINAYKQGTIDTKAQPLIDILAQEDGTEVKIVPGVDIVGGNGIPMTAANTQAVYTLNRGQFLQLYQPAELTGSPIESNKPIGVWGGSSCLYIPLDKKDCDSAHQQLPPIKAFGSEYAAVRYRGRGGQDETVPWRIVGAVDDTQLTWLPSAPAGAPEKLVQGQVADFQSPGGFVVSSQDAAHPFYLSAYMTAGELFSKEGDPEWVNVIPPAQFLSNYILFTDPTYSETNLVVVRKWANAQEKKFEDVFLDCVGGGQTPLGGWEDLGVDKDGVAKYQYTRVDLVTGKFAGVGDCANGRREMWSNAPFGVTVWGWGTTAAVTESVSYAYPAGASIQPINNVTVPAEPK